MYQYKGTEDTIAAIATPAGQGGIGIVRLSGREAISVADTVIRLQGNQKLVHCQSHSVHHGWVINAPSGDIVDEVLVILMKAPKSYTAEDVVEINCHGGMAVLHAVLQAVLAAGARLAMPGEFTKRAFLNGRMDLAQAEAVVDIIQAKTEIFLRHSHNQLMGELSGRLNQIRAELLKIYTMIEASINFPEEGIEVQSQQDVSQLIGSQEKEVAKLLKSTESGRILKEGIRIVLCGKPNVGKSSLLNALLKEQRAIVTEIAGTTRDVLEETAHIKGIPISLADTAGILEPRDLIEKEAVKRSLTFIKNADLVLLVLDHSRPLEEQDMLLFEQLKTSRVLVVVNKMDLDRQIDSTVAHSIFGQQHVINVSALNPDSIQELETKILEVICKDKHLDTHGLLISNVRHIKALEMARVHLQGALRLINEETSWEFVSEEIKSAVNQLDAITGRNIDEDMLESIFSAFCIGK